MATVDDKKIIFSMVGVSKIIPQNQKQILKNIYLSFFYFAYAGRAVKNHIGDHASVNGAAEHLAGGQEMALAAHFIQSARTQTLGKRFLHGGTPLCYLYI